MVCSVQSSAKKERGLAEMDTTTIGICAGLLVSVSYALLSAYAKKTFELSHTVLLFLAAFSVPGGIALIIAGLRGNSMDLPSSWREHVVVAGIVAIGLAVHYGVDAFKVCLKFKNDSIKVNAKIEHEDL